MAQAPVRLFYVAGIVAASLMIFTGTLSYGVAAHNRAPAEPGAAAPDTARAATGPQSAPVARPADTGIPATATATAANPPPRTSQPAPQTAPQTAPQKSTTHVAQPGETLALIAWLYGVDSGTIRTANRMASDRVQAGQPLKIPGAEPLRRHAVRQGDTLWELAAHYGVDIEDLLAANRAIDAGQMRIGQQLVIPPKTGTAVAAVATPEDASVMAAYAGMFTWPLVAPVSSPFGPRWGGMHTGVDLAASMNEPIKAARDGEVLTVGVVPGYGNTVILRHQDGSRSLYAHASKLLVRSGQKVSRGDVIALVGSTGHSSGPHLHFEIIVNNRPRDPLALLPRH